jgi:hypothetical protein
MATQHFGFFLEPFYQVLIGFQEWPDAIGPGWGNGELILYGIMPATQSMAGVQLFGFQRSAAALAFLKPESR